MKKISFVVFLVLSTTVFGQVSLLNEEFDGPAIPANWKVVDNDGKTVDTAVSEYTQAWIAIDDPDDSSNGTASSTSYFSPIGRADRWLITPQVTLGASGNFISWDSKTFDPSFPSSYKVMISTTGNDIADFTDTLLIVNAATPYWKKHTENLSDYAGQPIYFAFVNTTYDGFKLYMDSIYVRKQDPLGLPQNNIELSLYPNPVQDFVTINAEGTAIQHVQLYNSVGELVWDKSIASAQHQYTLSTANLKKGLYFISIYTPQGRVRRKLVK